MIFLVNPIIDQYFFIGVALTQQFFFSIWNIVLEITVQPVRRPLPPQPPPTRSPIPIITIRLEGQEYPPTRQIQVRVAR